MPEQKSGVEEHIDDSSVAKKKETEEMTDAFDVIMNADDTETDDDINKKLDEQTKKDEAGDATRDPDGTAQKTDEDDTLDPDAGKTPVDQDPTPAIDDDDSKVDWKSRALTAEEAAKDLKDQLDKQTQKAKSWKGRVKNLTDEIQELKEKLANRPTKEELSDQEKIDKFRQDFPELSDVVDIMDRRIGKVKPTVAQTDNEDKTDNTDLTVDPEPTTTDDDEEKEPTDHYVATREAHPDLDEMVSTGVILTWINKQPDYIKSHLKNIYQSGSVKQVVDMVQNFKDQTGWKSQLTKDEEDKKTTQETEKEKKLKAMMNVDGSESQGPVDKKAGPDKNDYAGTAKEIGL